MVRITPKDAQGMMDAYAKVYAPKEEPKPETEPKVETETSVDAEKTDKQKVIIREKMSKFGDLINGTNTPDPLKDYEVTITGIDETPVIEEEITPDISSMSKDELEDYGRTIGIELDRRHNKKKLVKQLQEYIDNQ